MNIDRFKFRVWDNDEKVYLLEISDGVKMVFTIPYIEETQEWVEYETNMPGWEKK